MITLASPVTLVFKSLTLSTLTFQILDDPVKQMVHVRFNGIPGRLLVWSGADYVAAGDYTEAALEERITTLLGSDPHAALMKLVPKS